MPDNPQENPLHRFFENNTGGTLDKWRHYFDVYHRHFARFRGTDPELLMEAANRKFEQRFAAMEQRLAEQGIDLATAGIEVMEQAWQKCKRTVP